LRKFGLVSGNFLILYMGKSRFADKKIESIDHILLRVERAKVHLNSIKNILKTIDDKIVVPAGCTGTFHTVGEKVDIEISIIFSEAIHQLRASLDYLVEYFDSKVHLCNKRNLFPYSKESIGGLCKSIEQKVKDLILFHLSNKGRWVEFLARISNTDKHNTFVYFDKFELKVSHNPSRENKMMYPSDLICSLHKDVEAAEYYFGNDPFVIAGKKIEPGKLFNEKEASMITLLEILIVYTEGLLLDFRNKLE